MSDYEQFASERLASVNSRIAHTAKIAGRKASDINLIAVSKTYTVEAIAPFITAGQRIFGENRVQEAQAKFPALVDQFGALELHLVGQLQSNKAEDAVALFHTIHSVDRESLITAIARAFASPRGMRPFDDLVDVHQLRTYSRSDPINQT